MIGLESIKQGDESWRILITASCPRLQDSMTDRYSLHFRRVASLSKYRAHVRSAEKSRLIAQPRWKRTKFRLMRDSASSRRTMRFYAFARFKEIQPLWIMPRFPARWRASRIQYLRPLSSYSRCSGLEQASWSLLRRVGCPLHPRSHPPVPRAAPVIGAYDIYFRLTSYVCICIRDMLCVRVTLHERAHDSLFFLRSASYTTHAFFFSCFFPRLILHVKSSTISDLKVTRLLLHAYVSLGR